MGPSFRNLNRRFRAETGLSPLQWLLHQRVDRARELLESTTLPMDQVARLSGLGSSESRRQRFVQTGRPDLQCLPLGLHPYSRARPANA